MGYLLCWFGAIGSSMAFRFLLDVGHRAKWSSDGPGILFVMIGAGVTGLIALSLWMTIACFVLSRFFPRFGDLAQRVSDYFLNWRASRTLTLHVANHRGRLIDRDDSALIVIDVQPGFIEKLAIDDRAGLVLRIAWLIRVAGALNVPVIAMAEDQQSNGALDAEIRAALPHGTPIHDKEVFGLAGQTSIRETAESLGRRTLIFVGLETDVCVAHSALGMLDREFRAIAVDDACGSPVPHHAYGISRMRDAGVVITSAKGLYFEWIRDLATHSRVRDVLTAPLPPGVSF
jgi:nicotinamidase-related amidase